jgi:hypothetical protein
MKTSLAALVLLGSLSIGSSAISQTTVFFEESFNSSLDPSIWRTEVATRGVRWCDSYPGAWWGPGDWVEEGSTCYGVAAHSPYGSLTLSDGMVHLTSTNGQACPFLVSRFPGATPLFPPSGDFTLKIRMRGDHLTPWGTFFMVLHAENTEPSGDVPIAHHEDMLLACSAWDLRTCLGGTDVAVASIPTPTEFHEISLNCTGTAYTIGIDGHVVYGPVTNTRRPTTVYLGNPALAYWYPTDWQWFSIDYFRIEVPGPPAGACCFPAGVCLQGTEEACRMAGGSYVGDGTPCMPDPCGPTALEASTWGRVKADYRE